MSSKPNQDHRVAVVTGGAGAIGGAIVARLAPDHTVVVLDRAGDVAVDLGDPDDVRHAAELVLDRYGRCDVFVHAAATFAFGPLEQVELDVWRRIQAVNVESALLLTQAFAPGMPSMQGTESTLAGWSAARATATVKQTKRRCRRSARILEDCTF